MWKIKRWFQKIKSRARQGKAFEQMIRAALKRIADEPKNKLWFQRIWDFRSFIRLNPKFRVIKQPADFMGAINGRMFMIECKSSQANRFKIQYVRPHQILAMEELHSKGSDYWIIILKRGDSPAKHRIFVYDYPAWLQLCLEIERCPYKTADWNMVATFAKMEIFRKGRSWDLKPLFGLK